MATLATETWTGTNGAAWPAQWTIGLGAHTIQSNAGQQVVTSGGTSEAVLPSSVTVSAFDITTSVSASSALGWAVISVGGWQSDVHSTNGYSMRVDYATSGGRVSIQTTDASGAATSRLTTTLALSAGTKYNLRFQRLNGVVSAWLWAATGSQPTTPTAQWTDTVNAAAGRVQLGGFGASGATTLTWDDLTVTDGVASTPAQTLSPTSIGDGAAVPSPVVSPAVAIAPESVGDGAVVGSPAVSPAVAIAPESIPDESAVGSLTATVAAPIEPTTVSPEAIGEETAAGEPSLTLAVVLSPGLVNDESGVGSPDVSGWAELLPNPISLPPADVGQPEVVQHIELGPVGVQAAELVAQPAVRQQRRINRAVPPARVREVVMAGNLRLQYLQGFSLLRINGQWVEAEWPTEQQTDAADVHLRGGTSPIVDDETADALVAAGYRVSTEYAW